METLDQKYLDVVDQECLEQLHCTYIDVPHHMPKPLGQIPSRCIKPSDKYAADGKYI